jgi:hypothetical protein
MRFSDIPLGTPNNFRGLGDDFNIDQDIFIA